MSMETLAVKPKRGRSLSERQRRLALASGARSAFDMSGLRTINDKVLRPRSLNSASPAEMIVRDMARVMARFGRSAEKIIG
jgi:hypothetical protein